MKLTKDHLIEGEIVPKGTEISIREMDSYKIEYDKEKGVRVVKSFGSDTLANDDFSISDLDKMKTTTFGAIVGQKTLDAIDKKHGVTK